MSTFSIEEQLLQMSVEYEKISEICSKDGIYLYRIKSGEKNYVFKYFEKEAYRREITNYLILKELGILTIQLIAHTDKSILMPDIEEDEEYRLGTSTDIYDIEICTRLAEWYHTLHERGRMYVKNYGDNMYMETNCITAENISLIKSKTHTQNNEVWKIIEQNLKDLYSMIDRTEKTLTYNDFCYENMIVAKDKSKAFMFDYNLLGKGYVASDIKNVTWGLGDCAKKDFINAYGKCDENEVLLHEVVGVIVSLYSASCREIFPNWGYEELNLVKNGYILECTKKLFGIK